MITLEHNTEVQNIINVVCKYTGVDRSKIFLKTRKGEIVQTRQIICYFLREKQCLKFQKIGDFFTQKHETVLHAVNKIKGLIQVDKHIKALIKKISDKLRGYSKQEKMYMDLLNKTVTCETSKKIKLEQFRNAI